MAGSIITEDHGSWVEVTLNRPEKLNSFNAEMHLELRAALQSATDDGKRALLLTGAGRGFCAGQDLGDRDPSKMTGPPDLSETLTTYYNPLVRMLRDAPFPVICAVNGVAAGAGANVALACDIVFAARRAKFVQSFVNVGLVPDAGGSWNLTRLLGPARAKALVMTGAPITAEQAQNWGLIWQAVDDDALMGDARALCAKLAAGPTLGLVSAKRAINAATTNDLDAQLALEAQYQKQCGMSDDYAEGVSAFLAKRPAEFSGK